MNKGKLILFIGAIVVLLFFAYQQFFGDASAGTESGKQDWQTIALTLQEDNEKLKKENTSLKQKQADITGDQQKLSKSAEAFLRGYFEYDQNSDQNLKNRVAPYSTQKLLNSNVIPTTHIEEGGAEEGSNDTPTTIVAKISKLNIYHSTMTNTSASVYADISQNFRSNNIQNTSELIAKLTFVYDVSKQTWLVDTMNIQPALPEDRIN
ncbi:hypothetical protein [Risungbinella massiliensis]|uniref:hypothetical protein n=1 Tax=Risungbinella massiliensis TaxID=1329796 RepID=UPI0005CBD0C1|nr:hypothetical protein [Risungbinella massiliensis]